jgi:flagellar FliL protein
MAQTKDMNDDASDQPKPGMKSVLIGSLIAVVIGGGSGFGLGYLTGGPAVTPSDNGQMLPSEAAPAESAGSGKEGAAPDHEGKKTDTTANQSGDPASGEVQGFVTALDPIVTNLSDPKDMWIRLELVVTSNTALEGGLVNQIHQDLFAHVRAMRLSEMAGPSAFIDLKAELLARARQRSEGLVQKVYVKTLLYE